MAILVHGQDPQITSISTVVNDIHTTDLPAVKSDTGSIKTTVDDIHVTDLPAVKSDTGSIKTTVEGIGLNRTRILQVELDQHADAGAVLLATATSSCLIESIVIKTKTFHSDLTSIAVTGGASNVVEFISAVTGLAANLDAADKQVSWAGSVELGNAKTIYITFAGTGSTHVTMTATIKYCPCTLTGALA